MKKYIWNKQKILSDIEQFMLDKIWKNNIKKCNSFFDVFAWTNNVWYYFKEKQKFQIYSNDINELSYILWKTYIELNEYPTFSKLLKKYKIINEISDDLLKEYIQINNNWHKENYNNLILNENKLNLFKIFTYLSFEKLPRDYDWYFDFIHRNYCENWTNSSYINRYWEKQKRMFFSDLHWERIDDILNLIIKWKKEELFNNDYEYYVLLTWLIEAVTLFSNTSWVYESYYKKLFPNTKQIFRIPYLKELISNKKNNKIFNSDILNLVDENNLYSDIIYLDPPYNSREYTSNYHLLNLIANYHNIVDPKKYEKWLILWRGQHKDTKFKSDFCKRTTFIDSMRKVITKISWKYVFISHYNWSDNLWKSEKNKEWFNEIEKMLSDEKIFKKWSFDFRYINRQNFQSRNWLKKENVNEIIFFAEKL